MQWMLLIRSSKTFRKFYFIQSIIKSGGLKVQRLRAVCNENLMISPHQISHVGIQLSFYLCFFFSACIFWGCVISFSMQLTFYALPCDKVAKLALDLVWIKAVLRVKLHSEPALDYPPLAQPIARTELLEHFRIFNKNLWNTGHFGQISLLQGQDVNSKLIPHFPPKHERGVLSSI